MERGGEVLAMGRKSDPVMLMDVRDLAEFCVHLVENEAGGIFNIAGPGSLLTQEEFLYGLRFCTGADVEWTWVDDYEFLMANNLTYTVPWTLLEGPHLGYTSINIDRAVAHGLSFRPLAQTHLDTRDWWYSDAVTEERRRNPRFPIDAEREADILTAWKNR
jgi:2'-hydroxyisoflavone reductase